MNHISEVSTSLHQLERDLRCEISASYFFSVNTTLEILNLNAHRLDLTLCKKEDEVKLKKTRNLEEAGTTSED